MNHALLLCRLLGQKRELHYYSANEMDLHLVDPRTVRDLAPHLLDGQGRLRIMPAKFYAQTTLQERALFGMRHGYYLLPTEELVEYLGRKIAGRRAIEIGAGSGTLAAALGIPATDNRQQERPEIAAYYAALGQAPVPYGAHVETLDAHEAVSKYRPDVVIACWVTHRYDPNRPAAEGNATGVLEEDIVRCCEYIHIGNERVHQHKPIWSLPHEKETPPWLYSRAVNGTPDFIATWPRGARA